MEPSADTTHLLLEARAGHPEASERLFAHLYDELRGLARARLVGHQPGATLNTTGLVHESFLRLIDRGRIAPQDRSHFMALAARAMRFVLLDRARDRQREKRGGKQADLPLHEDVLDGGAPVAQERADDLLAIDEALGRLRAHSERLADVVEYRFFGGFTHAEVAEITGRSVATVERDWVRARLWLYRALQDPDSLPRAPARDGEGPEAGSAIRG